MAQEPEPRGTHRGSLVLQSASGGMIPEQVDAFLERAHMLYEGEERNSPSMIFRMFLSFESMAAM